MCVHVSVCPWLDLSASGSVFTSHIHLPAALLSTPLLSLLVCMHLCTCVSVHELVASPYPLPQGFLNLASGVIFCSLITQPRYSLQPWPQGLTPGSFPGDHPLDTSSSAPQNSTHLLYLPFTIQSPALDHTPWEAQPSLIHTLSRHFIFSPTSSPAHNPFSLVEEAPSPSPTIPGLSRLAPAAHGTLTL